MKVWMMPNPLDADGLTASGITTVLRDYARHAAEAGIEFVDQHADSFDVLAIHAGMSTFYTDGPYVAHCHGLYWTGDYQASSWEFKANRDVISSLRRATVVTVPSRWVATTIQRDMHLDPFVLPHAIDPSLWKPNPIERKYILWNKNRAGDVCDPTPVRELALRFPSWHFISTFAPPRTPPNVLVTGSMPHSEMREIVQSAHIYLSTTKETFGIGMLEARASGVPILAYNEGGARDIVEHGVDGYLAKPGNLDDLQRGLEYCLKYHDDLSQNALHNAQKNTWPSVMQSLRSVYQMAIDLHRINEAGDVSVVIPCYNYGHTLERAVESVMAQTFAAKEVVIVDDGSTDNTHQIAERLLERYESKIRYVRSENRGVAHARNLGMQYVTTTYACCLDADDEIEPEFLSVCVRALDKNPDLGVAYTRLLAVSPDGSAVVSDWPGQYNFDGFLKHQNQVPTCCVFRKKVFERAGGYRARYAPMGAGSEDANLWLRMGALGYGGQLASEEALFRYHLGGRVSSGNGYREVDWLQTYAWVTDGKHPFASVASARGISHEVRQYDQPIISVVIPCSPGHVDTLYDAIDSVEGQSFRRWELIVVLDGFDAQRRANVTMRLLSTYPYLKFVALEGEAQGAGWARNRGAEKAISPYLLFLDADDWLEINCLQRLYDEMSKGESIVYSDYIGHAQMDEAEARKLDRGKRLINYDERTSMAEIRHFSADYDCRLAQQQPILEGNGSFYIWNIITSLMPRKWHSEIGGFDESMSSWEDWDYWIRMAQLGKCFVRIDEPLVHYRFYTGERREIGRQHYTNLLDYMLEKYREVELMPCSGCRGRTARVNNTAALLSQPAAPFGATMMMSEEQMVTVELIDGNIANHPISMRDADGTVVKYGYRKHGDQFLMKRDHAQKFPAKFKVVSDASRIAQDALDVGDTQELAAPTPLRVYTASETDKVVAQAEASRAVTPEPAETTPTRKKPGPKPSRR